MPQTITKSIGEGFAHNPIYAALSYDSTDHFGGYEIKDVMHNTTYRTYYYDTDASIYGSSSGVLALKATTIAIAGNVTISGSLSYGSETVSLNQSLQGTLTVGVSNAGYDVLFYGRAGSGQFLWNADQATNGGVTMLGAFDITGDMAITGALSVSTTLAVAGDTTITAGSLTVGLTTAGTDVLIFGADSTYERLWDADGGTDSHGSVIMKGDFHITGLCTHIGALTVGEAGTSHDVTFYADASTSWVWGGATHTMTVTGDTVLTGDVGITGAVGIDGDVTMVTQDQINFEDTATYIHASSTNVLAIVGPTIAFAATTAITMDETLLVTITNPAADIDGIYSYINAGGSSGWSAADVVAVRGYTLCDDSGQINCAYGGKFELTFGSSFGTGDGLTAALFVGVKMSDTSRGEPG